MRKMKKINGYLVVKFNDRELREWEGTALGKYGVIDAELYTGTLEVDRGAMEYDNADSIEEAVELARGLESELDTEEPEVKVTLIKETDEATEEEEVDAQKMIAGWENTLRGQVASPHYKDVDERTAAHELYGYKAALRDLGLLDREDCYVLPDTFGEAPGPLPKKPEELLAYVCDELCRHRRPEMTQEELDAVCEKCSLERLANEADGRDLQVREKALGALYGLVDRIRDRESSAEADRVGAEARAYLRALAATGTVTEGESAALTAAIEEARTAQEEARQKQADAKARLKSQQAEVDALISQISSQEDELEAMEAKLQAAAKAMDNEIARKERELQAQLAAQGVTIVSEKGFKWPSYATTITSLFGSRTHPVTGRPNNHTGVDIAAAGGTDIWAAKSGVVLTSTYNSSYGNYVVISHANGESTLYAHMSKRLVSEGDKVTQGQTIGLVGTTGSSTGNHLHFEVRLNGQRQDPLNYFRGSTFTLRASGKSVSYTVS